MITKEIVAEPFGGVTIVAMGAIDADVIETVQANERCLTPQPMLSHAGGGAADFDVRQTQQISSGLRAIFGSQY